MATQQQLLLRQKLLQKKVKPTADPLEAEKNKKRFDVLQGVQNQLTTKRTQPGSGRFGTPTTTQPVLEGKPDTSTVAPADGGVDTRTYAEIGKSLADASYNISDLEKELYGDTKTETSMDKYFNNLIAEQERQAKRAEESLAYQQEQTGEETALAKNQMEQAGLVQEGQLFAGGREGVTSGSNLALSGDLASARNQQITRLQSAQNEAFAQIEDARAKLAFAEKQGRRDLVAQYQSELDAAEMQAKQIDTDYISALTEQSQEERAKQAQQAQNIESFATLVQQGTEMDYNTISSLASQYGLPTDMLMGYYQGAQAIRDDKTLDLATKETQLAQLNQDLADQVAGINTAQAQNIEYLKKLYQSGADPDVIAAFKSAAGITDYNDPFTIAELNYKNAQVAYQESATAANYQNLLMAQAEYDELYGGEAYLPNGAYDFEAFTAEDGSQGIRVAVTDGQSLDIPGTDRREDWCAAFVNDALGTAFGDTFEQKASMINSDVPAPGMAFVMATAEKWGHVGIVESVNFTNGTMTVVESNWQKGDDDKGIISRRTMFISDAEGFVKASKSTSTNDNGLLAQQANALIFDLGGTAEERAVIASQMVQMVESGQAKDLADAKSQLGLITKSDRELQDAMTAEIKPLREDFNTAKSKLASLPELLASGEAMGDVASIVNFLKVIDPNSVARETEVASVEKATSLLGQMEQYFQKIQTGEKLNDSQREQLASTADILASSFADTYLQELYRRQDELAKKGIPMTFASTSEISSLESFLGADRVNQIKEGLGLDFEPTEDDYINTLVDFADNSDTYDYIDSKTTTGNKSFGSGFGSLSPFKK